MKKGGPALAIGVCRDEAQALTAEIARAQGVRVGRTSDRLRNPGNAAPSWAERFVEAGAGRKAATVEAMVVDLGDRVGVLRPIPTAPPCLQCHGHAEGLSSEARAFIKTAYPADRAIGFEEGDLRGLIWAEVPVTLHAGSVRGLPSAQARCWRVERERSDGSSTPAARCATRSRARATRRGRRSMASARGWAATRSKRGSAARSRWRRKRGVTRKPAMLPYPEFSDEELEAMVSYPVSLRAEACP